MNILSIGGSDPSSGAGIQSDVKVFSSFGIHCLTIITAITSQNTSDFGIIEPVSQKILKKQLESIISDFKIEGVKIGMVYNSQIIKTLYQQLKKLKVPIVIDPVIKSTTGGMLIEKSAIKDFQKFLVPLATVLTPNKFEAEILSKIKIDSKNPPKKVTKLLQKMGAKNIVITGIKIKEDKILDFVQEKNTNYFISGKKIPKINHGSGCNYSAAVIFALVSNKSIKESMKFAKEFTYNSIKNAKNIGKGIAITSIQEKDNIKLELLNSINKFGQIKNIYKNIPECQTNFVYSKEKPNSVKDVLGISGRIVKTGNEVTLAGDLSYGGSKHVASALLVMNKKFPQIYSAINLKYENKIIGNIKKSKLKVCNYDRTKEPKNVKLKGSTIKWGIKNAIKDVLKAPDVIYHKGGFGKEPMIIIFGITPNDVLEKILKIV